MALRGDRATLTGRIRIQVKGQEVVYSFVDKFVWRDGRWQAVGSEGASGVRFGFQVSGFEFHVVSKNKVQSSKHKVQSTKPQRPKTKNQIIIMSIIGDAIESTKAIIQGMGVTLSYIPKRKWTVQYPEDP